MYFKKKDDTLPVWIQLRPMKNGAPSDEEIIPGSNKILDPVNVQTSTDGSVGTDFEFDEPIYLNPQTEYALVVLTDASNYNLFISRMGEFELGSTEKRITKQPTLGSMYKPQSVADWEPSQLEDLMFIAYRASFDTGTSTAYLQNISLPNKLLHDNPITTTSASAEITIKHNEHGLFVGDTVTLSGIVGNLGGFSQDSLNSNHIITAIDGVGYTFDMDSTASITTTAGGDGVIASEQMLMDKVFPYIETIAPEETALQYKGRFHTGKSFAGNETAYAEDTVYSDLNNKEYNYLVFSGIGNHKTFINMLKNNNLKIVDDLEYPDHYQYSQKDFHEIINKAKKYDAKIITTEKDYLRLDSVDKTEVLFIKSTLEIIDEKNLIQTLINLNENN